MKKNIIIAATAAAAGIAYYFINKKRSAKGTHYFPESKPAHHITDVFARAKEQAVK